MKRRTSTSPCMLQAFSWWRQQRCLLAAAFRSLPVWFGVWVGTGLFYAAGLILHGRVPRLRPAAVAFTGTGLAIVPFAGIASYTLGFPDAPGVWLATSLVGTAAYAFAAVRLKSRLVVYLSVAFLLSAAWSSVAIVGAALAWYFAALIVFSAVLSLAGYLLRHASGKDTGTASLYAKPLQDLGPWFAPAGLAGSLGFGHYAQRRRPPPGAAGGCGALCHHDRMALQGRLVALELPGPAAIATLAAPFALGGWSSLRWPGRPERSRWCWPPRSLPWPTPAHLGAYLGALSGPAGTLDEHARRGRGSLLWSIGCSCRSAQDRRGWILRRGDWPGPGGGHGGGAGSPAPGRVASASGSLGSGRVLPVLEAGEWTALLAISLCYARLVPRAASGVAEAGMLVGARLLVTALAASCLAAFVPAQPGKAMSSSRDASCLRQCSSLQTPCLPGGVPQIHSRVTRPLPGGCGHLLVAAFSVAYFGGPLLGRGPPDPWRHSGRHSL